MNLEKERDTKISEVWTYDDWVDEINRISLQEVHVSQCNFNYL